MPHERVPRPHLYLHLRILGRSFRLSTDSESVARVLKLNFFDLIHAYPSEVDVLPIVVRTIGGGFEVSAPDCQPHVLETTADLVYCVEKIVIVEVQRQRPDLFFVHAAALDSNGRAVILAGDSGAGKSTMTWALLQNGFGYLSDELSAISLESMEVLPYPHALCLKRRPPIPYFLPEGTLNLGSTMHVPTPAMTCRIVKESRPLGAALLIRYDPDAKAPAIRELTQSEAAARLYVNGLNSLAHPDAGLAAVVRIASCVPCFTVVTTKLDETCLRISALLRQVGRR